MDILANSMASFAFVVLMFVGQQTKSKTFSPAAEARALQQIDRSFVCPETLTTEAARNADLKLFLETYMAAHPGPTLKDVLTYRISLLKRHQCTETLHSLLDSNRPQSAGLGSGNSSWSEVGRVRVGPNRVVAVSIDKSSVEKLGPEQIHVWIKYSDAKPIRGVIETLSFEKMDCKQKTHSSISLISYAANGAEVSHDRGSATSDEPIIPDSLLATALPYACALAH